MLETCRLHGLQQDQGGYSTPLTWQRVRARARPTKIQVIRRRVTSKRLTQTTARLIENSLLTAIAGCLVSLSVLRPHQGAHEPRHTSLMGVLNRAVHLLGKQTIFYLSSCAVRRFDQDGGKSRGRGSNLSCVRKKKWVHISNGWWLAVRTITKRWFGLGFGLGLLFWCRFGKNVSADKTVEAKVY